MVNLHPFLASNEEAGQGAESMLSLLLNMTRGDKMESVYLYVDGESHYIGTEKCWERLHPGMGLERLRVKDEYCHATGFLMVPRIRLHHESSFFWDAQLTSWLHSNDYYVHRPVYVTSIRNDATIEHEAAKYIRDTGFEPVLIREDKEKRKQPEADLTQRQLLIKPKGVDIALTVRMMEDAQRDLFRSCFLVTSDADYLPLIEAVRRMGKHVWVVGYKNDFTKQNPRFEYVPDRCFDIGDEFMRTHYYLAPPPE